MALAYGPLIVGMICQNSNAVSAKIEEGMHAHTGNILKTRPKDSYVQFCHAADSLGPAAAPAKNAVMEEELIRLRTEKNERDDQLQLLQ